MTKVALSATGPGEIREGGKAGSINTGDTIQDLITQSKAGPIPVQFFAPNSSIALTQAEAERNPKAALVPHGGSKSTLAALLNAGLIVRDPATGSYYDVRSKPEVPGQSSALAGASDEQEQEQQQPPENELADFQMTPQGAEAVKAVQEMEPDIVDYVVKRLAIHGDEALDDPNLLNELNQLTGKTPDEAGNLMRATVAEYVKAAEHVLRKYPMPAADVFAWARKSRPDLAQDMIYKQIAGDFSAHHVAAKTYLAELPSIDRSACLNADLGPNATVEEIGGRVIVKVNGRSLQWADALREGGVI